ncbi:hypothetical protein [Bradyrhizobium sp. STM 3562]|uniref:hypothetical protein n=1 Tax=Bradyrhizobium sp. STM 3562 TaxID=578924 RepID=UPI00388D0103
MATRKNLLEDLVSDAPALAPGLASDRGALDGPVPAPGAARAERQSRWRVSANPAEATAPDPPPRAMGTLKERARQMSLYLEPATYDSLREIAHRERTKMHVLLLQAVDEFLKKRGPSE